MPGGVDNAIFRTQVMHSLPVETRRFFCGVVALVDAVWVLAAAVLSGDLGNVRRSYESVCRSSPRSIRAVVRSTREPETSRTVVEQSVPSGVIGNAGQRAESQTHWRLPRRSYPATTPRLADVPRTIVRETGRQPVTGVVGSFPQAAPR